MMNDTPHVAHDGSPATVSVMMPTPPPARTFSSLECLFAWISLAAAYLFCRAFPVALHPLGGFLLIVALFTVTLIVLKLNGAAFGVMPMIATASAVAVAAALIVCDNRFLHTIAYTYALSAYMYTMYACTGNTIRRGFSDLLWMDFLKALCVVPFFAFGQLFVAMFSGKARHGGKFLAKLLAGAAFALIPTALVMGLLSYDRGFSDLLATIVDIDLSDIASHVFSLICAILPAMYLFGAFIASSDRKAAAILTAEQCRTAAQKIRIAPAVTVLAAVVPLLAVYVIFFISQWPYYVSAFTGVLPDGFSYAQYAREGFFRLCAVSLINLLVIVPAMLFMRRKNDQQPWILRLLCVTYAVFTLILISTALAKMFLYIDYYGLTQKRVYATWMMVVLALIFILIGIKPFVQKLPAAAASLGVCVTLFAALALVNADGLIASYNIDRYLDGTLPSVDVSMLHSLGDAAVPDMVRLYDVLDERNEDDSLTRDERTVYNQVKGILRIVAKEKLTDEADVFAFTIPSWRAEQALRDRGML